MSLLNDALQDLDRRASTAVPSQVSTQVVGPRRMQNKKRLVLPVFAGITVFSWYLLQLDKDFVAPTSAAQQTTAVSLLKPVLPDAQGQVAAAPEPPRQTAPRVAAEPEAETVVPAPAVVVVAEPETTHTPDALTLLLQQAGQALARDRLMSPRDNNAYSYFKQALDIEPGNVAALAGIASVIERYYQLIEQAFSRGDLAAAKLYLQRAETAGAPAEKIASYRSRWVTHTPAASADNGMSITGFDKDKDVADRLRADPPRYEDKAWQRLRKHRESYWTTMALADTYAARRDSEQLLRLQDLLAGGEHGAASYVRAQWLIVNGQLAAAVPLLAEQINKQPDRELYLRLLAGVQATLQHYNQALPVYQQLLQLPGSNTSDWLGYALALERTGDRRGALAAYQRIRNVPHSDRRINEYIRSRIGVLAGELSSR